MEIWVLALAVVLAGAMVAAVVYFRLPGSAETEQEAERVREMRAENMEQSVANLITTQAELAGRVGQLAEAHVKAQTGMMKALEDRLDAVKLYMGRSLSEQTTRTNDTLTQLQNRLSMIDEAQQNISELSGHVGSLQDVLSNKQARGAFGEMQMTDIVSMALPPSAYTFQKVLSNGRRVDCMIDLPQPPGSIAIDAQFPLETYHALRAAKTDAERQQAERAFRNAVLKHVVDIAERFIIPNETAESALMFLPSEAVYAELHSKFSDVIEKSFRARVWIVSPTTLMATLNTVRAVLKDARMREQAQMIQKEVSMMTDDVARMQKRVLNLQAHFGQTEKDIREILISADKIARRSERIEEVQLGEIAASPAPAVTHQPVQTEAPKPAAPVAPKFEAPKFVAPKFEPPKKVEPAKPAASPFVPKAAVPPAAAPKPYAPVTPPVTAKAAAPAPFTAPKPYTPAAPAAPVKPEAPKSVAPAPFAAPKPYVPVTPAAPFKADASKPQAPKPYVPTAPFVPAKTDAAKSEAIKPAAPKPYTPAAPVKAETPKPVAQKTPGTKDPAQVWAELWLSAMNTPPKTAATPKPAAPVKPAQTAAAPMSKPATTTTQTFTPSAPKPIAPIPQAFTPPKPATAPTQAVKPVAPAQPAPAQTPKASVPPTMPTMPVWPFMAATRPSMNKDDKPATPAQPPKPAAPVTQKAAAPAPFKPVPQPGASAAPKPQPSIFGMPTFPPANPTAKAAAPAAPKPPVPPVAAKPEPAKVEPAKPAQPKSAYTPVGPMWWSAMPMKPDTAKSMAPAKPEAPKPYTPAAPAKAEAPKTERPGVTLTPSAKAMSTTPTFADMAEELAEFGVPLAPLTLDEDEAPKPAPKSTPSASIPPVSRIEVPKAAPAKPATGVTPQQAVYFPSAAAPAPATKAMPSGNGTVKPGASADAAKDQKKPSTPEEPDFDLDFDDRPIIWPLV